MQAGQELLRKWDERGRLYPRMEITGDGLMLGAGTILARTAADKRGNPRLTLDDELRVMALLATAHERPVEPIVVAKLSQACELWNEGEKALAHIHLAHTSLPPCDEDRALRLFAADELLKLGVTPDALLKAQGFDPAPLALLLKYSPDQLRVPAGNGRQSGRWTSEEGAARPGRSDAAVSEDDGTGGTENVVEGRSSSSVSVGTATDSTEPHVSGQQLSFAGTLIDKRFDEVLNITHCTYSTPLGTYTLEFPGFYHCEKTTPVPPWLF